jgi:hypothetical protein
LLSEGEEEEEEEGAGWDLKKGRYMSLYSIV